MQTGTEAPGRTVGFEIFDEIDPEEVAAGRGDACPHHAARPARRPREAPGGVEARGRRGAVPRGVRTRSRGRSRRQGRLGVPRSGGRAGCARRWSRSSTTAPTRASGAPTRSTTKARPRERNVLIEDGVLTDYMWDLVRARKHGRASSGNGRRETYQHLPMVRMTNTFLLAGDDDPDDIIRDTPHGLYCVALGGGQVEHRDRRLRVRHHRGLHDRARPRSPSRCALAQLIGNGPETLRLRRRGRLRLRHLDRHLRERRAEACPVSSGQPTLRVAELTVGGTAGE